MKRRMCDEARCLASVGNGSWHGATWTWHKQCCDFGLVDAPRARELLRGRQLVFLGDSTARRHMWAVVDAVGGEHAVRRRVGAAVADSGMAFDRAAVAHNDTLYDSQRAYHAGQVVLLNVDSGAWRLVDPLQLCGVPKEEWTVDGRLVRATQQGHPPPWHSMRGTRYRIVVSLQPRCQSLLNGSRACARQLGLTAERVRGALQAVARSTLRGWGCQAAKPRECSYQAAVQRNCARGVFVRRLRVAVDTDEAGRAAEAGVARAARGRGGGRGGQRGGRGGGRGGQRGGGRGGKRSARQWAGRGSGRLEGRRLGASAREDTNNVRGERGWHFEVLMGDGAAACRLPSEKLLAGLQRLLQQPADPLQQRASTADPRRLASGGGGSAGGGGGGRALREARRDGHSATAEAEEAEATRLLGQTRAVAPPRLAPFCERFCRKTHQLECPGGFEAKLAAAVERHAGALALPARRRDALAVLVFSYEP